MSKVPTWAIINARTGSRVIFGPVMHNNKVIDNVLKIVILRSSALLFLTWLCLNYIFRYSVCSFYLYRIETPKKGTTNRRR